MIRHRRATAIALTLAATLVGVFSFAAPASAHVTVDPKDAVQGSYARLAFRVPTESDTASTVKLEVVLPEDAPVASVSTMPVPGWTVTVERRPVNPPLEVHGAQVTEAVSKITWTATGDAGIKPGEFLEFPVSMGPLPATDQMVFKALQTYSNGMVVRWIEEPPADGSEVESPAPVLKLTPAAGDAEATPSASDRTSAEGIGGWAYAAVIGLVAGVAGLVLGALAFARTRRAS
jgi:uncharacterized protein YcnI